MLPPLKDTASLLPRSLGAGFPLCCQLWTYRLRLVLHLWTPSLMCIHSVASVVGSKVPGYFIHTLCCLPWKRAHKERQ